MEITGWRYHLHAQQVANLQQSPETVCGVAQRHLFNVVHTRTDRRPDNRRPTPRDITLNHPDFFPRLRCLLSTTYTYSCRHIDYTSQQVSVAMPVKARQGKARQGGAGVANRIYRRDPNINCEYQLNSLVKLWR